MAEPKTPGTYENGSASHSSYLFGLNGRSLDADIGGFGRSEGALKRTDAVGSECPSGTHRSQTALKSRRGPRLVFTS